MDSISAIVSLACVAASTPVALTGVRAYRFYGQARLVTCPETVDAAVVRIHATRAIASRLAGRNDLPLRSCSRWPERRDCDQACVTQLRATPGARRPLPPTSSRATCQVTPLPARARRASGA
jgi:hypothetical protein